MRHTFPSMGTVASIELAACDSLHLGAVELIFRDLESRFSLYRPESEISRLARHEIELADSSERLRDAYVRAIGWRTATGGVFSPHRPDGVIDLDGIIKAEAIEQAGAMLDAHGCLGWTINVGGDILIRTDPTRVASPVGIADPTDPFTMLCSIILNAPRRAIATSGSAQRGDHIWLGGQRLPADFLQVSVVADDIVTADVLATAIVAGGRPGLDSLTDQFDIDVLAIGRDGGCLATPGFRAGLTAAVAT